MASYSPYTLNSFPGLPSRLAIRCPRCRHEADLQFPFLNHVWMEVDRRYTENTWMRPFVPMAMEEIQCRVASRGVRGVLEWDGIQTVVARFPNGFPLDWQPSIKTLGMGWGTCICSFCGYFQPHAARWPDDGYFTFKIREHASGIFRENIVWAYTRGHAIALRGYIASDGREAKEYPAYEYLLQHVPKVFLRAKNREFIVRRLQDLLRR